MTFHLTNLKMYNYVSIYILFRWVSMFQFQYHYQCFHLLVHELRFWDKTIFMANKYVLINNIMYFYHASGFNFLNLFFLLFRVLIFTPNWKQLLNYGRNRMLLTLKQLFPCLWCNKFLIKGWCFIECNTHDSVFILLKVK